MLAKCKTYLKFSNCFSYDHVFEIQLLQIQSITHLYFLGYYNIPHIYIFRQIQKEYDTTLGGRG